MCVWGLLACYYYYYFFFLLQFSNQEEIEEDIGVDKWMESAIPGWDLFKFF
jgi:hypothetical protein